MNNFSQSLSILITGGAGFIGSAMVRYLIKHTDHQVVNIDALTYAGHLESLTIVERSPRYKFEKIDICNAQEMQRIFKQYQPDLIMNFAAESHVDRSINDAQQFIQTNIVGTYILLEQARCYYDKLKQEK